MIPATSERLSASSSSRGHRRASFRPKPDPRTPINMEDERTLLSDFHPRRYIARRIRRRAASRGRRVEDLRMSPRHLVAAGISCGLKDDLHLSSPRYETDGRSDGRLFNMTDRSLDKPSKCTVRTGVTRPLGGVDAGSAILVTVRNRRSRHFRPMRPRCSDARHRRRSR